MQINVVNIIIDSLLANGKCSIDGLGTFILNKDLPQVDSQNQRIDAPKTSVSFEDSIHDDFKLDNELLKVYPFSEDKSKKVVSLFANKVVNGLINFDHIELRNLGVLRNNKKNNGLAFTISPTLNDVIKASQPDVDLKPFLDAKAEAEKQATQEAARLKKAEDEKKARIEKEKAAQLKKELEKKEADRLKKAEAEKLKAKQATSIPPAKPKSPITNPVVKETVVPASSKVLESPVAAQSSVESIKSNAAPPIKENEVYIHKDDEGFFSKYLPWILLLLLLIGVGWGFKKIVSMISIQTDNSEVAIENDGSNTQSTTDQVIQPDDGEGEGSTATTPSDPEEEVKEKPVQPSECIIITGSYLDQQNMDEMASKIRKMGYEVYTEKYGYYTRVGFKFPCQDVNLKLFIEEIRAKISKESWYLIPDLSI